jgi:hypothetical protein
VIKFAKSLVAIGMLSLGACAAPAISDISTDKVKIQSDLDDLQGATGQANHGCSLYKRVPVYLSKRRILPALADKSSITRSRSG